MLVKQWLAEILWAIKSPVSGVPCREVFDSANSLLDKYWCDHLETNKFEGLSQTMAIKTKYVLFKVALIAGTGA